MIVSDDTLTEPPPSRSRSVVLRVAVKVADENAWASENSRSNELKNPGPISPKSKVWLVIRRTRSPKLWSKH